MHIHIYAAYVLARKKTGSQPVRPADQACLTRLPNLAWHTLHWLLWSHVALCFMFDVDVFSATGRPVACRLWHGQGQSQGQGQRQRQGQSLGQGVS